MYDYGYRPEFNFFGNKDEFNFYGVEIELDGATRCSDLNGIYYECSGYKYLLDEGELFAYLKRDGSLVDGVEIVTMPGTLEFWQDNVKELQNVIGEVIREFDVDEYDTCGMHVHIDRRAFNSDRHIVRFNNIVSSIYETLLHIARRGRGSAYEFAARNPIVKSYTELYKLNRYYAVNTEPSSTVEFRLPASTTDAERAVGYIELVDWLIEISQCDDTFSIPDDVDKKEYLLSVIPERYKYLRKVIEKTNFDKIETLTPIANYIDYYYDDCDDYDYYDDDDDSCDYTECSICHIPITGEIERDVDGNPYCRTCARDHLHCRICHNRLDRPMPMDLCSRCYNEETTQCRVCGITVARTSDNLIWTNSGDIIYVCRNCRLTLYNCPICGRELSLFDSFSFTENNKVCCAECAATTSNKGDSLTV